MDNKYIEPYRCPKCNNKGRWRTGGPAFENEMICFKCWETWTPYDIIEQNKIYIENLMNTQGDGI